MSLKIKNAIKIFLVMVLLLFSCINTNNIYAYNLNYEGEVIDDPDNSGYKAVNIRTYAKAASTTPTNKWIESTTLSSPHIGSATTYNNCGLIFHRSALSKYESGSRPDDGTYSSVNKNSKYFAYYDTLAKDSKLKVTDKDINTPSLRKLNDLYKSNATWVAQLNSSYESISSNVDAKNGVYKNNSNILYFDWNGKKNTNKWYTWRNYIFKDHGEVCVKVTDTRITGPLLKYIFEHYDQKNLVDDSKNFYKIMFSIANHTTYNNAGIMETAYEAMSKIGTHDEKNNKDFATENRGYEDWQPDTPFLGGSIINAYDNWLYLPLAKFNQRNVTVLYRVRNDQNEWITVKEEKIPIDKEAVTINKKSINSVRGYSGYDAYYMGGRWGRGATLENATTNMQNTTTNEFGYNTTYVEIPAGTDREEFVIYFNYAYRNIQEKHLTTDEKVINSAWNVEYEKVTIREAKTVYSKGTVYYNGKKYNHVSTKKTEGTAVTESTDSIVTFYALDGNNGKGNAATNFVKWPFLTGIAKFYYQEEPARTVYVRHYVYNTTTNQVAQHNKLKNSTEPIKDYTTGTTHNQPNGFNQRKWKENPNGKYTDTVKNGFEEQYTIDRADSMSVNKSANNKEPKDGDAELNGYVRYVYMGAQKANNSEPSKLTTRAQIESLGYKTPPVGIEAENVESTYVDMYYIRLEPRKVKIRYIEIVGQKDGEGNNERNDIVLETEEFFVDNEDIREYVVNKSSMDRIKPNTDRLYIGGKVGIGVKMDNAEADLKNSPDSWGWNQTTYTIPAKFEEEQYVIEFYYDHREIEERHLKIDGSNLNPAWNRYTETEFNWPRASWPRTQDTVTLEAKNVRLPNGTLSYHVYYQDSKWKYAYTDYDQHRKVKNAQKLEFSALSGANALKFGDSHYGYFYYEFEAPRKIRIRHFSYNTNSKQFEQPDKLTNSTENVTDFETGLTTSRPNGFNQRKFKSGSSNYIDPVDRGYNEQFTLDKADSMTVNRSAHEKELKTPGNRNDGWIRYKYLGHIKQDEREPRKLTTRAEAEAINDKTLPVKVNPSTYDNTFVDMYYVRLEPRTVTIRYVEIVGEKDTPQNKENNDIVLKTEKFTLDLDEIEERTITKQNIDSIKPNTDRLYIGGSIGIGEKIADAENDLKNSPDSWGWNTNSYKIPALFDEEQYVIEFYYDHREMLEKHLKTNGSNLNPAWNRYTETELNWPRASWPRTQDIVTLEAKNTIRANGEKKYYVYHEDAKWQYTYTEYDGNKNVANAPLLEFGAISGANALKFGDSHYGYFYYEFVKPAVVYVRHYVYDKESDSYKISDKLTNTHASVWDYDEMIYYLRPNGFNQRKWKCEHPSVDNVASGYNEQYTIDMNDKILIDKSLVIADSKVKYEYEGYRVLYDSNDRSPLENIANNSLSPEGRVTVEPKNKEYVCVEFYYTPKDILPPGGSDPEGPTPEIPDPDDPNPDDPSDDPEDPPEDTPKIDFIPKKEDDETTIGIDTGMITSDCRTTFVPSDEKLKPYLTAVMYKPYTLIYKSVDIDPSTGKIIYQLKDYETYLLENGTLKDYDESKTYGNINSTNNDGVFNTDGDLTLEPDRNKILEKARNSINYFHGLDPTEIFDITLPEEATTTESDYNGVYHIEKTKYNGLRRAKGTANYDELQLLSNGEPKNIEKNTITTVDTENDAQVVIYTPISVAEISPNDNSKTVITSAEIVNHSNKDGSVVIQKNAEFSVTPRVTQINTYADRIYENYLTNPEKYIEYYWFVADFNMKLLDTREVYIKEGENYVQKTLGSGTILPNGAFVRIEKGQTFKAIATSGDEDNNILGEEGGDIVNNITNRLKVLAIAINTPDEIKNEIALTISPASTGQGFAGIGHNNDHTTSPVTCDDSVSDNSKKHGMLEIPDGSYKLATNMYYDMYYMASQSVSSNNIGRIYGFKVTDCLDVNMKNIFRKNEGNNVNDLTGIQYFSGIRKLLIYGGNSGDNIYIGGNVNNQYNVYVENSNINHNGVQTILPFGPYKHTSQNYLQAPKLGYRISFDVKTSGFYTKENSTTKRYVTIKPSYYYISKAGGQPNFDIKLYYKNSAGKYVNFQNSGYNISFKPNDGYRNVNNLESTPILTNMSTKLETLEISNEFKLTDNMMSFSENGFVQAWYGEFKLPNSTIAVANGSDINNPLKDGYIGVIFDIKCIDQDKTNGSNQIIVSYNQGDKNVGGHANTTQWDYEGYLGYPASNNGADYSTSLQLERGIWQISGDIYKKIKGTVVLYDIDNKAAEDFD